MPPLTRYVPIRPAPSPRRPPALPATSNLDASSPTAISRFDNNTPSETRHHVDPDLSALYSPTSAPNSSFVPLFDPSYAPPPFDPRPARPNHYALATQPQRLRTSPPSVNYGPNLSIPTNLPPTPRTTSRHTPRSPDKHTFAVPRVPAPKPPPATTQNQTGFAPDFLQNYLDMISTQTDAVAPVDNTMTDYDSHELAKLIQSVAQPTAPVAGANPTPFSTPILGDYETMRSLEELLTSPEFTSPLWEDTPSLSDASPFTPSSSSIRHQTSPPLIDYSDSTSGGVPLFGTPVVVVGTPNLDSLQLQSGSLGFQNLDHLLSMPNESPISPAMDTQTLFSPQSSPLFDAEHTVPAPARPAGAGQRSVSDPVTKRVTPTGHRKNLSPEQLLPVDAPTQQRNYYGPSATSRKVLPSGFEDRRAKIVAKRRRGVESGVVEMTEEEILHAAVEDKRRANTVAARRSRQRKLEHVKNLEQELEETKKAMELWKERAIAAENMLKQYRSA
ncbi:hypothetical protein FRC06_010441 [Ceratobasidium sp. 370]|nr:hypothetical protein FRC06_010441 [Ceratobasidium sp. 370]